MALQRGRDPHPVASYLRLYETGELAERARLAVAGLAACRLCPRQCGVDRGAGSVGECRTGRLAKVASAGPHFGEEDPLVGRGGSGTVFFAACNLACVFCQNHDISQGDHGREVHAHELAELMLELQQTGCENINLVSPSHVAAQILEALVIAVEGGLRLPLVYNTGGYDAVATLRLLDGVIDIYMPDMKYADESVGLRLSGVADYVARNREAVKEMHRQVGDLRINERGVAPRGLLVRHLVLPDGLAGTADVCRFLAREVSPSSYVNIMAQYRPAYRAFAEPSVCRPVTRGEYQTAVAAALEAGLHRLD